MLRNMDKNNLKQGLQRQYITTAACIQLQYILMTAFSYWKIRQHCLLSQINKIRSVETGGGNLWVNIFDKNSKHPSRNK